MAQLTVQDLDSDGLSVQTDGASAASGGDSFRNDGKTFLAVHNGDASGMTVTLVTPQTVDGNAVDDKAVAVAAGETEIIGPLPTATYNDSGNDVSVTYSSVTSLTVLAFRPKGL